MLFRPERSQDMEFWEKKSRERTKSDAYAEEIAGMPDLGERVGDIYRAYPWIPPGLIVSLAKTGIDEAHPLVQQAAQMEFQRRTQQGDWTQSGDLLTKPKGVTRGQEEPQEAGTDFGAVGEKPVGPEVAPQGGSQL